MSASSIGILTGFLSFSAFARQIFALLLEILDLCLTLRQQKFEVGKPCFGKLPPASAFNSCL
ncbi:hypothetical protein [Pseudomonas syringae]|uniref:hypothetical protein n=1 Tax=Pseudomonas syringae TaxID=317 RepID=UPI000CD34C87|nr:hypothetical protein [Pseudomonas syringae]SOP99593.1 putative membrane protein [Pseudomonas syringae pv. syringae]